MLRPAAAAVLLLLTVLGPGLSLSADDGSDFSRCSQCFYKQTPPQSSSAGTLLRPLCHKLPTGQMFATLSKPTCDTAVYCAFHSGHGQMEEEGGHLEPEEMDGVKVAAPSLLRGDVGSSGPVLPTDPGLQHWDLTLTNLFQSSIRPQCSTVGGDLYILTGVGGLQTGGDGDECQTEPLWSAFCCAAPEGSSGFSGGLIRETGAEDRQVSTRELQELLGVGEMFSEGCGGADAEAFGALTSSFNQESTEPAGHRETDGPEPVQENQAHEESAEAEGAARSREERPDVAQSTPESESPVSSSVEEQETDENATSTLVYILSTTMSILKAPLQPVVSTVTHLPGQVNYVLQEDLGVLSALPGHTFSLLHLLASDLCSWIGSAADLLLGVGETGFSNVYYCTSSMLGALFSSCYTGVTGLGTLAGDTVGVFGEALDNGWWVTKFFGGRLWDNSEGYVVSVASELGGQTKAVGGGLWKLVWRCGSGVCNVFHLGGGIIFGILDLLIGTVSEAFGQESSSEEGLESVLKS